MATDALRAGRAAPTRPLPWLLGLPFPVRGVARRWRGMVGMVVGVGVALGLVLTMMGLLGAAMGQLVGDFRQSGIGVFIAANGGKLIPLERGDNPGTVENGSALLTRVRGIPGVQAAIGELSWSLRQEETGPLARYRPAQLLPGIAVDGDATEIANLVVMRRGRWLRRGNEVVVGPGLSASRGIDVGGTLRLYGRDFEVVGVGKLRGFGQAPDSAVYLDARALRQLTDVGNVLTFVAVQTTAPAAVRNAVDDVALRTVTPDELEREVYDSTAYASAVAIYWIIDLFILFVAGMFVTNMLGRAVAERRIEFGTLRAIGVPSRTILASVVAEALFVVVCSFALGFAVSLALGWAVNAFYAPVVHFDHLFAVDPGTDALLFGITLALGAVAGFFPARAATRVDPLDVLREA